MGVEVITREQLKETKIGAVKPGDLVVLAVRRVEVFRSECAGVVYTSTTIPLLSYDLSDASYRERFSEFVLIGSCVALLNVDIHEQVIHSFSNQVMLVLNLCVKPHYFASIGGTSNIFQTIADRSKIAYVL